MARYWTGSIRPGAMRPSSSHSYCSSPSYRSSSNYRCSSQRRRWVRWLYFAVNAERDGAHRMLCFVVNVALSLPCKCSIICHKIIYIHEKLNKRKQTSNMRIPNMRNASCRSMVAYKKHPVVYVMLAYVFSTKTMFLVE